VRAILLGVYNASHVSREYRHTNFAVRRLHSPRRNSPATIPFYSTFAAPAGTVNPKSLALITRKKYEIRTFWSDRRLRGSVIRRKRNSVPVARKNFGALGTRPEAISKEPPTPMQKVAAISCRCRWIQYSCFGEPIATKSRSAPLAFMSSMTFCESSKYPSCHPTILSLGCRSCSAERAAAHHSISPVCCS